jgi:ribose transport system substrate-binding protein
MQKRLRAHRHARLGHSIIWMVAVVCAATTLAACGSSGSSATSSASAGAAASASSTGTSSGSGGGSGPVSTCLANAHKIVSAESAPLQIKAQSQPIDMSKLKGKTIYVIDIGSGYSLRLADGITQAARLAGIKTVLSSGATPQQWNTGIQQAVSQHAAGIIMVPIVPALVASSTAQAKAAGIPVVNENSIPPPATGITANVLVPTTGQAIAAQAVIDNNCHVNAVTPVDPTFVGLVSIAHSIATTFKQLCPSTCKAQQMNLDIATLATQAGPALQSLLERNPSINAVMPTFDSMALIMQPALVQSGSKAKLYSEDGDAPNMELVRKGQQAADYSYAPTQYQGFIMVDTLARAILKMKNAPPPVQFQLFTPSTIPQSTAFAALWPKLANYESVYKKLWGLS